MRHTSKSISTLGAALLVPVLLAGCSSSSNSTATSTPTSAAPSAAASVGAGNATAPLPTRGAELANTKWALSGLASTNTSMSDSGITLDFAVADASGNAGVNTYNAGYTATADAAFGECRG